MTILSPSPEIRITSDTSSWPRLTLTNSRQISPLWEMLAITFLFLCRVGLSLVEDSRGGREDGEGGRGEGAWLCCDIWCADTEAGPGAGRRAGSL